MASDNGEAPKEVPALYWKLSWTVEKFLRVCEERDLTPWAEWGTLLGFVRHGWVIPWDFDADFGLFAEGKETLFKAITPDSDPELRVNDTYYNDPFCLLVYKEGEQDDGIDVDLYGLQGNKVLALMDDKVKQAYPAVLHYEYDPKEDLLPLLEKRLFGCRVFYPADWKKHLDVEYGTKWDQYPQEFQKYQNTIWVKPPVTDVTQESVDGFTLYTEEETEEHSNEDGKQGSRLTLRGNEGYRGLYFIPAPSQSEDNSELKSFPLVTTMLYENQQYWNNIVICYLHPGEVLKYPSSYRFGRVDMSFRKSTSNNKPPKVARSQ